MTSASMIPARAAAALLALAVVGLASCAGTGDGDTFEIPYEKYVLDNGLEVILHEDHSDPIVAVATLMHVGSAREKPGRTGFAHFFEHMSFNDSENVPRGANRKYIPELGGQRNGGTWSDGTVYYEVVPKDAFEKILWIDSDRLGYMINTVTEEALEREKQVVKNEKRQRNDNAPYGHTDEVIRGALYPPDHPYHWTVIGSLPDLQAATLADVREFYDRYYGAANATLVIAGDIDIAATKELVDYWFGEIRRGPDVEPQEPLPVTLAGTSSLMHEDNFAKLPELRLTFPAPEQYHPDTYALDVLAEVLAGSKKAPLYQVLVEERKLAPEVSVYLDDSELAGEFVISVRANDGVDLDEVKAAIDEGMARFAAGGFTDGELARVKAERETALYYGVSTVLNKAFQLANYNEYAGDPGYVTVEAERMQAVAREDVMDVFRRYVMDRPCVTTSFVPAGQPELALAGAQPAEIWEEPVTEVAEHEEVSQGEEAVFEKTPTAADRSEPSLGEPPLLSPPAVWQAELAGGLRVLGSENDEVPLVSFDLTIRGGHWLDPPDKAGVASLLAELMMQGTAHRTPAELEEALGLLGAFVNVNAGYEEIHVTGSTLARNFAPTMALVEEILLEPRWDVDEYERLKLKLETRLKDRESSPPAISAVVFQRLVYGDDHILSLPQSGTLETAANITLDDLKAFYARNLSPAVATFHVVGDVSRDEAVGVLEGIAARWPAKDVPEVAYDVPAETRAGQVYFVDVPGSKQSVIRIGCLALSGADDDHNNLEYANERLGGGASGRLFQQMRIEKGWTYGAYSFLGNTLETAPFQAASSVRANVTLESLQLMRELLENYRATFGEEEMEVTKNQVIKANTRAFESLNAKLGMLQHMSKFGKPADYVTRDQQELMDMGLDDFHRLIETYIDEDRMFYLVVGDAETQLARMAGLGYGPAVQLDVHGDPVN